MMLRIPLVASAVSSLMLAGCYTVTVPINRTVDANKVCGDLAERYCAPSVGPWTAYRKQRITLTVTDGSPDFMNHLGRILRSEDTTGTPGQVCGITDSDRSPTPTHRTTLDLQYTMEQKIGSSFEADLVAALATAQVPQAIRDRLRTDIRAVASSFDNQTINVRAEFSEHQLRQDPIDRLRAEMDAGPAPGSCAARLASGDFKLVRAISVIHVPGVSADYQAGYELVGSFGAALRSQGVDDAKVAAVEADVREKARQRYAIAYDPYWAVMGVSYWRPDV